ncbi:ATP-dependent RNA helicase DDX19/DBP5, partial [Lecanoromycetidae sp. Uapishka_2]
MASLEDRITKAENGQTGADPPSSSGTASSIAPSVPGEKQSWADETAAADTDSKPAVIEAKAAKETSGLTKAQTDGAGKDQNGESGIFEPSYDVDVKHENILKGIYQMRFTKPSKIQEKALPLLLMNPPQNMIGQSQSGTGKTAAFTLNILARLDLSPRMVKVPQALVLAPSRELARQIVGVFQVMGQALEGLIMECAIPVERELRGRKIEASVVIGTPGTTLDLIQRRQLNASMIKILVLDEADNMLDLQGLGDQCLRVKQKLPQNIQVVLFSATFPDRVVEYASRFSPNANQITLKHEELTVEGIKQLYLDCPTEADKFDALVRLYGLMTIGSSIIFVRTRKTALELERRLNEDGHTVACLTGDFEGGQRDVIIDHFRSGQAKVLIATNVLSRGIDDLPDDGRGNADPQTYLHRIGRTGRFGRVGVSISLITGRASHNMIQQIQEYFAVQMTALPHDDWDKVEEIIKKVIKSSRAGTNFKTTKDVPEIDM